MYMPIAIAKECLFILAKALVAEHGRMTDIHFGIVMSINT